MTERTSVALPSPFQTNPTVLRLF